METLTKGCGLNFQAAGFARSCGDNLASVIQGRVPFWGAVARICAPTTAYPSALQSWQTPSTEQGKSSGPSVARLPRVNSTACEDETPRSASVQGELGILRFLSQNRKADAAGEDDPIKSKAYSHLAGISIPSPATKERRDEGKTSQLLQPESNPYDDRQLKSIGRHIKDIFIGKVDPAVVDPLPDKTPTGDDSGSQSRHPETPAFGSEQAPPASLGAPSGTMPLPSSPARQILDHLGEKLVASVQDEPITTAPGKINQLRVVLAPQSLGEVHIVLRRRGKELSVTIVTTESSSAALLRPDLGYLQEQLKAIIPLDGSQKVTITLQSADPQSHLGSGGTGFEPESAASSAGSGSGRERPPSSSDKDEASFVGSDEGSRDDSRSSLERRLPGLRVV